MLPVSDINFCWKGCDRTTWQKKREIIAGYLAFPIPSIALNIVVEVMRQFARETVNSDTGSTKFKSRSSCRGWYSRVTQVLEN